MNKHTTHRSSEGAQAVYSTTTAPISSSHSSPSSKRSVDHAVVCGGGKHKRRRERREIYYEMIDRSLPEERHFSGRIIDALNRDGMDIAHDGRPIKVYWRHYMKTRRKYQKINTLACLYLLDKTFRSVRPKVYL